MKKLNVVIIGAKFMGKAHSSSWSRVHRFFDVPSGGKTGDGGKTGKLNWKTGDGQEDYQRLSFPKRYYRAPQTPSS